MKKSLLKFLPLMAAVLLATSCKKDDDNNAPANGRDGVHTVSTSTIPFSIKVNTGNSLKKVGYKESTAKNKKGYYSVSFDENDYEAQLKMVIKTDDKEYGELFLQKDLVTFSGTLKEFPEVGTELTAVVTTSREEGSKTFSDKSLEDLFEICAHTFEGKFNFKYADKDAKVTLTDQNVYLAIAMSPCCDHEISINDETFTVQAGRIWIAVPAKDGVKSVGLGTEINKEAKNINPGEIHNVIRQYFTVDATGNKVHFSKGNLQCVTEGENKKWQFADHQYDYLGNADDLLGWNSWLDGSVSDIGSEWKNLSYSGYKYLFETRTFENGTKASDKWGQGCITVSEGKTVNGVIILPDDWTLPTECKFTGGASDWENKYDAVQWKAMEANGAVFLPAAGYRNNYGYFDDGRGYYWSSTNASESSAYRLNFYSFTNVRLSATEKTTGQSVRLVRPL